MKNNNKAVTTRKSLSPQIKAKITKQSSKNLLSKSQHSLKESGYSHYKSIQKNRSELSNKLQTYSLLIRSKNPIRCLQHNSNISIYCQTEQKLLCANCIFGKNDHRFHRVITLEKCYDKMQRDIELMNRLIHKEIESMNKTKDKLMQNLITEEKQTQECLMELVNIYEDCHRRIQQSFIQSKNKILDKLSKIRSSHERKLYEIQLLLTDYSSYNISTSLSKEHIKPEDYLVYEHLICNAISSQKKFQQKDWLAEKGQIKKLTVFQSKKIKIVAEEINKILFKQK